ncbi:MAG: hypothetical protein K0S99_1805 [Thermomicrobiales bacterium]|jgi:hypothetical protein|nr:hypothetical protein [Thermomicrobiales bacterium]
MPDENGAGAPSANDAGASPTDTSQSQAAGAAQGSSDTPTPKPATDTANRRIKEFAESRGITVSALLDQFQQLENAGKSELEKAIKRAEDAESKWTAAEQRARTTAGRVAVYDALDDTVVSKRAVWLSIKDDLEFDDDGEPTNVKAVVAKAKQDDPNLFPAARGSANGGDRGKPASGGDINSLIRQAAGRA